MKTKILFFLTLMVSSIACGQASPDATAKGTVASTTVEITYSSPRVKERTIYGDLVPYDKVWRAGANKNTTVKFDSSVKINGKELAAGKYGFFIIPTKDGSWTAIFSNKNDAWGSSAYKESEDALRVEVKAKDTKENVENLTYKVTDKSVKFAWSDKYFEMKIGK